MMKKPKAVLISDIHFTLPTLELASYSLQHAINTAEELKVPLFICGDTNDTKSIIRAEIANRLIEILSASKTRVIILIGNHDRLNEKSLEHSLNFLEPYATIVNEPDVIEGFFCIPYYNSLEALQSIIQTIPKGLPVLMHQGFLGAFMGDYIQDKTSIDPGSVKNHVVFSGHYHKHQQLSSVTYIGNPYTLSYGEANDGPKGYLIVNEDSSFERVILDLRKHFVLEYNVSDIKELSDIPPFRDDDLVWLKIKGTLSELNQLNKEHLQILFNKQDLKIEYVILKSNDIKIETKTLSDTEILDSIIDKQIDTDEWKTYLKGLWRETFKN